MNKKSFLEKIYIGAAILIVVSLMVAFLFTGNNFQLIKSLFDSRITEDHLRQTVQDLGIGGYLTITLFSALQVLCPFLPAQPLQVLSGIAFGFPIGAACCIGGFFLGSCAIYLLFKLYGNRLRGFFIKDLELDMDTLAHSGRISFIVFLLYLIPALPYGMTCFFAVSVGFSFRRYTLINMLGVVPSILFAVGLGEMTITSDPTATLVIFALLILAMIILLWKRKALFTWLCSFARKEPYSSKTTVKKCNKWILNPLYVGAAIFYRCKGIRVKTTNKVGKLPKGGCVVLCNHGSFIDFYYSVRLLRKYDFNFVSARLYFYHKKLGGLMKRLGCFPKSMFTNDLESTKNCIKVIREGRVLVMMPEARLSTVGEFEDIQERTYSFLKKLNVPVYTIQISGDYFSKPKWGQGMRRGSKVEAVLDILFTPEQLAQLDATAIKAGVENRLRYDEFAWLSTREDIHYKHKKLAHGLENILTLCPICGAKHSIQTQGMEIFCEKCGKLTQLNDRYGFTDGFRFQNFAQWYHWQKEQMQQAIENDPSFSLISQVEYRLPDHTGKALTRHAGEGICTLSREGLTYTGTKDGEEFTLHFPISHIYRLLFGAGENFEVYSGNEIQYFVPAERRSAVDWYLASMILYDNEMR